MRTWRLVLTIAASVFALLVTAQADTAWNADVGAGAAWSASSNWSDGVPDAAVIANFTNTQATTYSVDVDTAAVATKLLATQGYTFSGTGSITLERNDTVDTLNQTLVNNSSAGTLTFNSGVTINQIGTKNAEIYCKYASGGIILSNGLTHTGNGYMNLSGLGTIEINGDIDLADRFRFGKNGMKVIIDGSGTTTSSAAWTFAAAANLYLNRAGSYTTDANLLYMEKTMVFLGADHAVAAGTDVRMKGNNGTGGITAQGFDQDFGWLDVDADALFDMDGTDSVWTFEDSSLIATMSDWASGVSLAITNAASATVRFEIDSTNSGTGLTESQIGKIFVNGTRLTTNDTFVTDGYLYVVSPDVDSSWNSDVSAGAAWETAGNWSAGVPGAGSVAYFTNTQSTTYHVAVDSAVQANKLHDTQGYTFDGSGSITLVRDDAASLYQTLGCYSPSETLTVNSALTVTQLGEGTAEVYSQYAGSSIVLNGDLTHTGNSYLNLSGEGTIEINGDISLVDRFRFGKDGMNLIIGGTGTTASSTAWTFARAANLYLNRAGAYTTDEDLLAMEKAMVFLGADNALAAGTDVRMKNANGTGGITAQGYDQDFGWLDVDYDALFDLSGSDSIWTFEDSSAQAWGSATLYITNAENAVIRFALGSGTGLSESQIETISLNGTLLTANDTSVSGGYLYIVAPAGAEAYYDVWGDGYSLSSPDADLLSDPDADGVDNLIEYALGGNPTNSDASVILPAASLVDGGATLEMVYLRRLDAADRGLTYTVEKNGDLLADGVWSSDGITETSGAVDANFESVTNRISTATADAQFMKLSVEFE